MKRRCLKIQKLTFILLFLSLLISGKSIAQITGSLFMLPNNFYAQMYNPSYMRTDKGIEISVAGLGGLSFINQGNFKISDLITTPFGSPVLDIENFYESIDKNNFIRQNGSVPVAFISIPLKNGVVSMYYKENINSVFKFRKNVAEFLVNGNLEPEYKNFNTGAVKLLTNGYREFALGYAKKINRKLNVGVHAKLLFGAAYLDGDKWNIRIETSPDGGVIKFVSEGKGRMVLPVPVLLHADSTIFSVESENAREKYFKEYQNPGFAFDLGATYQLNKNDKISVSVRDVGAIWYKHNPMAIKEDEKFSYFGFDLVSAVRFPEEPGYTHPLYLIDLVKDSLGYVWHPRVVESRIVAGLGPKTVLHYQHAFSKNHSFGVTNQSAFQKNNFQNIFTLSALQSWANLSVFENVNLHGVSDVSIGGGIQYESNFLQFFMATDNLFAFYHPANNKTFSVTAGICLLLNHKKEKDPEEINKGIKKRKGKISPELPFYKRLKELLD